MFSVFEWFVPVLQCDAFVVFLSDEPTQNQGQGLVDRKLKLKHPRPLPPPVIILLAVPRGLFCFGS